MDLHFSTPKMIHHIHDLPVDYEGKVLATLMESRSNSIDQEPLRKSILYIHGFSDYFFQEHLMEAYNQVGVDFYALDLRKYGRSLLPHQHPNYCKSLKEYFPELDYAINFIKAKNPQTQLVLMGHSTGGLLVSYYAHYGALRNQLTGLILNSPFLDFNTSNIVKLFTPFIAKLMTQFNAYASYSGGVSDVYGQSLLKEFYGEWEFNQKWKPVRAFPAFYAWILAVHEAQQTIRNKTKLDLPILLMHSDSSLKTNVWSPKAQTADLVLNVKDIERIGVKMSNQVTHFIAKEGLHDLFLSKKSVRDVVFENTMMWLEQL